MRVVFKTIITVFALQCSVVVAEGPPPKPPLPELNSTNSMLVPDGPPRYPIQWAPPAVSYNPLLEVPRVAPSPTKKLKPGTYIDYEFWPKVEDVGEFLIQKLTDRTYWLYSDAFNQTVYVGDKGVLLMDAPQLADTKKLLAAIASITDKPLTALVYSHPHFDHIGKARELKAAVEADGGTLRIIASQQCVREIDRYRMPVPRPTDILPNGRATFEFEGKTFIHATPVDWAHTGGDSYTLTPDKVINFVDMAYPKMLPMANFSGAQNLDGYVKFLRHVLGEDWVFGNFGHESIGYKEDVATILDYVKDLYATSTRLFAQVWSAYAFAGSEEAVGVFIRNNFDQAGEFIALSLQPKWGQFPHYEISRDHATQVAWDVFLNYDFRDNPQIQPSFEPIAPIAVPETKEPLTKAVQKALGD